MATKKYLTKQEREHVVLTSIEFFIEKLEKKYKVQIMYNVDEITTK